MTKYRPADFIRDVQASYSPAHPDSFWTCEAAVGRLISENLVTHWFNERLRAIAADPLYVGDWRANEVVFHRGSDWTLSVAMFTTPRRFIHALPLLAFYAPLANSILSGDRYRLPEHFNNEVFDPNMRLQAAGTVSAKAGEILRLESDKFAYDFSISKPIPVLRFATSPIRPLEWLFSKTNLHAWQANDADIRSTQLRVSAHVLGRIAHQSSIAPLRALAKHKHHSVRWAAIQNLGRLNRTEALELIRDSIADPHPHVRRAAQKTLDQFERRGAA